MILAGVAVSVLALGSLLILGAAIYGWGSLPIRYRPKTAKASTQHPLPITTPDHSSDSNNAAEPATNPDRVSVIDEEGITYTGIVYNSNTGGEEAESGDGRRSTRSYHYTQELAPASAVVWLGIPYAQAITSNADRFNPPSNLTTTTDHSGFRHSVKSEVSSCFIA